MLAEHPDRTEALVGAAEAWSLAGQAETALARAEAAGIAGVQGAQVAKGRALLALGRGGEAVSLLEGQDQPVLLAEALLARAELDAAAAALPAPGVTAAADILAAWLNLRRGGLERCEDAVSLARTAVELDDENTEIAAEASWVAQSCGSTELAADLHRQGRAFERSDAADRLAEANLRRQGGDAEGAARRSARAMALYPEDGLVARELGVSWLAAEQPGRAVEALRAALARPPYDQSLDKHEIIVGAYSFEADERADLIHDIWMTLALALAAAGDPANAAAAHERALLAEDDASSIEWAQQAQRWTAVRAGGPATAAAKRAVQLDHTELTAWQALAEAQLAAGQPRDAVGAARKAWALEPGPPETAVLLARAALAIGEEAEARRVIETALRELGPQVHPLIPTLQALLRETDH